MKTYLITGGAGFIGSNFIHYLMQKYGDEVLVINVDKLTYAGNLSNLENIQDRNNYFFIRADINDRKALELVFNKYKPDIVINFAAESHVDRSINYPRIFTYTNISGTQVLLDYALKYSVSKYVQISTDEVYGSLGEQGFFTEKSLLKPSSPYSASKASADLMVEAYYKTYGLPVNITRCSNNYGPFQSPEKLIPLVIEHALNNKPVPVYGNGMNIRDWIFVKDHCRAVDYIANQAKAGEIYNIGANCEMENIRLIRLIIDLLKELLPYDDKRRIMINYDLITFVEDRKGHDFRYAVDSRKIRDDLGWRPEVSFEEGIRLTIEWYLRNQKWLRNAKKRITNWRKRGGI
ncbi:dTDP-glucose 4,6-dehydratase [Thermosyntropha sp.]|uniref:dTDP-glucose 4,6-dehydratase n=1 Tax=Thermosyntropha sp. TaxID=2740820 RepID=UPI0025CCDA0B|nr:dTDP-glucose 4,6-dehydratase [Thermosyntropha sp.]MBO8159219.1 dTDP-glucose 4,6-dehydratase [Thermosyntropha sp.]